MIDAFRTTKRRGLHGSFIIDADHSSKFELGPNKSAKTNIDPVGHLMGKRNTGVFVVNHDEVALLGMTDECTTHIYLESGAETREGYDKAVAYVEAVSQLPEYKESMAGKGLAYTSDTHWNEETMRTRFDNITWFDNAWTGFSWGDEDVTPPCFWTKNYTDEKADKVLYLDGDTLVKWPKAERFWEKNEYAPFKDRTAMIDDHMQTFRNVMKKHSNAVIFFNGGADMSRKYASEIAGVVVVHKAMLARNMEARKEDASQALHPQDLHESLRLQSEYKSHLIAFDTFESANEPGLYMAVPGAGKTHFVESRRGMPRASDAHTRMWKEYEKNYPDRGWRVAYDTFASYEAVLSALVDFLNMHVHEVHVWIQGTLQDMSSTELLRRLKVDIQGEFAKYMNGRKAAQDLWHYSLDQSTDLNYYYASRPPQRIPTVPWRTCNMGMRIFSERKPQVFPASTWMSEMGLGTLNVNAKEAILFGKEVYVNYSGYVKMIPLWDHDAVDFAWKEISPNEYVMVPVGSAPGASGYLYKVANPDFFMGMGSVATSQHSVFGLGRSEEELYNQAVRKLETGTGTSGHMIASALCCRAHFMWYLEEVHRNLMTKKSIYLMPFNEPAGTEYHTIEEYRNAIVDMDRIAAEGRYPKYALAHLEICRAFVNLSG